MTEIPTCEGCRHVVVEPAAGRNGDRVFIRCGNPHLGEWTGRVTLWCKAEYAESEMKRLPRPKWCNEKEQTISDI